ncbi:hypothetical protein HanRHA438_Chr16g0768651 [Helianthus annuus]|nr:hypothetical protein HanRHA438_Chr16g0768651 [Helianthus annuus]
MYSIPRAMSKAILISFSNGRYSFSFPVLSSSLCKYALNEPSERYSVIIQKTRGCLQAATNYHHKKKKKKKKKNGYVTALNIKIGFVINVTYVYIIIHTLMTFGWWRRDKRLTSLAN